MTPKQFDFWCSLLERTALEAYARGREDQKNGKLLTEKGFRITGGHRLLIKKEINKLDKNR